MEKIEIKPKFTVECSKCQAININESYPDKCSGCGNNTFKLISFPIDNTKTKEKLNECYLKIIDLINDWIDIPKDYVKIVAIWCIGTYFHKQYNTYPYLFLNAMRGSGKTRLLRLVSWLQANGNGEVLTNPSDAVLFRTAKERGLILDEFESERSKEKQTMREYLNSCYKKGGIVYRMERQKVDGKEQQVAVGHPLYTPVAIANINGIEDVLGDRSIPLIIEKSMNPGLTKKVEDFSTNPEILAIKSSLNKISVELCSVYPPQKVQDEWNSYIKYTYYTSIHTIHNSTQPYTSEHLEMFKKIDKTGIYGRNLELYFPLLLTGNMISDAVFNDLLDVVAKLNNLKKDDEFNDSKDVSLIEFVATQDTRKFDYIYTNDLFREFKDYIGIYGQGKEEEWLNVTWFGSAIQRLKLHLDRKRVAKGIKLLLAVDRAKEKLKVFRSEQNAS